MPKDLPIVFVPIVTDKIVNNNMKLQTTFMRQVKKGISNTIFTLQLKLGQLVPYEYEVIDNDLALFLSLRNVKGIGGQEKLLSDEANILDTIK